MASVSSSLTLYSGVALDNTYEHTYANTSVFSYSSSASPASPLYYIRPDKNMVRIKHSGMKVAGMNLYNCNYLTFKNSTYENKTFYCFVKEVRYINDEVAEIDFEVDVMMTWVATGNVTFEDCFVEREHTNTDKIGEHILEEPVDIGDYVYSLVQMTAMPIIICAGVKARYDSGDHKWKAGSTQITYENGYYVCDGVSRYYFDSNGNRISTTQQFGDLQTLLLSLTDTPGNDGKPEYLAFVYYFPNEHLGLYTIDRKTTLGTNFEYTPKNKKLLTYPYYGCSVNNFEGCMNDYAFELANGSITFQTNTSTMDASASICPLNYAKSALNLILTKNKYPTMSASSNEYTSYMANLKATMAGDLVSNVAVPAATGALIGGSGVIGAAVGAGAGLISYVAKSMAGGEQAKLEVTSVGTNAGFLQANNNTLQFGIYRKSIRTEYAEAIDDFFTKFGYKVNRLKTPTKTCPRLSYKYVKTIGCAITGNAPAVVIGKISEIMDNGITFWNKGAIGEY